MMDMYGQSNAMGQNQETLKSYFENMKNQFTLVTSPNRFSSTIS